MSWHVKVCVHRHGEPHLMTSFSRSPITLGAEPHNDVVLKDSFVSGEHAVVMVSRGELVFRDQSTNGSFFQGQKIREQNLGRQATISIPPFDIELAFEESEESWKTAFRTDLADIIPPPPPASGGPGDPPPWAASPETPSAIPGGRRITPPPSAVVPRGSQTKPLDVDPVELRPPEAPAAGPDWASTVLTSTTEPDAAQALLRMAPPSPELAGQEFALPARMVRVGRSESADVTIAVQTISRLHASVQPFQGDSYFLTDLDSANGTFVNGLRVKEAPLQDGDEIRFGDVLFRFCLGTPAAPPTRAEAPLAEPSQPPSTAVAELDIDIRPIGSVPIYLVTIRGRIDGYNYTQMADLLDRSIEEGGRFLIIDLSEVDYVSHTGLGVFVKCLTRLQRLRGDLRLAGLNQRILDAFSLSRIDSLFRGRIVAGREQALADWGEGT
ncbi:MAG: FHA domain-containing protein [bacterium]|nr:FHA domain-containing protein [bacterium]